MQFGVRRGGVRCDLGLEGWGKIRRGFRFFSFLMG